MWISKKKLDKLLKDIAYVQERCQILEQVDRDTESEMKSSRRRGCPNGCTTYLRWSVIGRPLTQIGKFYICSECGYTEPYKEPKYTSFKSIRCGLEDLEEKVEKLMLPAKIKARYKKPAKKKKK
jgi:hypothetical protein